MNGQELLDTIAVSAWLGVSHGTLEVWRSTGKHNLPYVKVGRSVRYRRKDVETWLEKRTRITGSTK